MAITTPTSILQENIIFPSEDYFSPFPSIYTPWFSFPSWWWLHECFYPIQDGWKKGCYGHLEVKEFYPSWRSDCVRWKIKLQLFTTPLIVTVGTLAQVREILFFFLILNKRGHLRRWIVWGLLVPGCLRAAPCGFFTLQDWRCESPFCGRSLDGARNIVKVSLLFSYHVYEEDI